MSALLYKSICGNGHQLIPINFNLIKLRTSFIFLFCRKNNMIGKTNKKLSHDDIRERLSFFLMNYEDPELDYEIE